MAGLETARLQNAGADQIAGESEEVAEASANGTNHPSMVLFGQSVKIVLEPEQECGHHGLSGFLNHATDHV